MAEHGFQTVMIHKGCHDKCETRFVCPECGAQTWIARTLGRWDSARNGGKGATAIPFDPVAWGLSPCGHIVGNYAASQPHDPALTGVTCQTCGWDTGTTLHKGHCQPTGQECVKVRPDPGHENEGYSCVTHNCAWDECPAQTDQEDQS